MNSPPDDPFQQYIAAYQRRAAARATIAHQFINAVAGARLLEDMEEVIDAEQGNSRFASVGRFVQRVLANLPLSQHQQSAARRPDNSTIIEGEVISSSSAPSNDSGRASRTGGTQPPIVIVIDRDERPDEDVFRSTR